MKSTMELAKDLQRLGADMDALAMRAVKIAAKRGYITAELASGVSVIAARNLGFLQPQSTRSRGRFKLTAAGRARLHQDTMTNPTIPEPGLYRLSRDVTNPHPDRRTRHSTWLAETWEKGTVVRIEKGEPDTIEGITVIRTYLSIGSRERQPLAWRSTSAEKTVFTTVFEDARQAAFVQDLDRLRAILDALEPVKPSNVKEWRQYYGVPRTFDRAGDAVLQYLVDQGIVSLDAVALGWAAYVKREC